MSIIDITEKQVEFVEDMTDLIMKKFSECEIITYTGYKASFFVKENVELGWVYLSVRGTGVICMHLAEYRFSAEEALQAQKYSQEYDLALDYTEEEQEFMGMWFADEYSTHENLKLIKKYIVLFAAIKEIGHKIELFK